MEVTKETLPAAVSILITKVNHLTELAENNNKLLNQSRGIAFFTSEDLKDMLHITPGALKVLCETGEINQYAIGGKILYKLSEIFAAIEIRKKTKEVVL